MMSDQKEMKKTKILELIGICLVITALISAYGLYYTSQEYAKVTETQLNADAYITGIAVSKNISDLGVDINILVLNNISQLDIKIYMIEYSVYASDIPINRPNQMDFLGTVASASNTNFVEAGTNFEYTISMGLDPTSDQYDKLVDISPSPDNSAHFVVSGTVFYKISGPSGLQGTVPFYFVGMLEVSP